MSRSVAPSATLGPWGGAATSEAVSLVNRAPVLTLWAAVVAEQLGFERAEALTLGRVLAGLNAYAKGVSLGLFRPTNSGRADATGDTAHASGFPAEGGGCSGEARGRLTPRRQEAARSSESCR